MLKHRASLSTIFSGRIYFSSKHKRTRNTSLGMNAEQVAETRILDEDQSGEGGIAKVKEPDIGAMSR